MKIRRYLYISLVLLIIFNKNVLFSQSKITNKLPITSIYFAPFALSQYAVGNMVRGGIEQRFVKNMTVMLEGTHYFSPKRYYSNLKGYRFETGLRYYFNENETYLGTSCGFIKQSFQIKGKLPNEDYSVVSPLLADCKRDVKFLHFSIGQRFQYKYFYFETGIQLGVRIRDVDIQGVDETSESRFYVNIGDDNIRAAMRTEKLIIPDFAFLLRVGLSTNK